MSDFNPIDAESENKSIGFELPENDGADLVIHSSPVLDLGVNFDAASFERVGNDLLITTTAGECITVVDFFVYFEDELPEFRLSDGATVRGGDLLAELAPGLDLSPAGDSVFFVLDGAEASPLYGGEDLFIDPTLNWSAGAADFYVADQENPPFNVLHLDLDGLGDESFDLDSALLAIFGGSHEDAAIVHVTGGGDAAVNSEILGSLMPGECAGEFTHYTYNGADDEMEIAILIQSNLLG
ncbi:hypothetical protein LJC36_05255 [Desulfovibrio sp. OttesenSCG-928-C14]|nr:hypothetical protein [Desulfovibrio sp. OttesenSCG-928-C14]